MADPVLIGEEIVKKFKELAEKGYEGVRLTGATWPQKRSSIAAIYDVLVEAQKTKTPLAWSTIEKLVRKIDPTKQKRYGEALKYLQETLEGHRSKIFAPLRAEIVPGVPLSEKLAKVQQRYTLTLMETDPGHGLCLHMALIWLKEQLAPTAETLFPRGADESVVQSAAGYDLTKQAAEGLKRGASKQAGVLGLKLITQDQRGISFDNFADYFLSDERTYLAFVIGFFSGQHAVALYRKGKAAKTCRFFDANAGDYEIPNLHLKAFLLQYNICLFEKWTGKYGAPAATQFDYLEAVRKQVGPS